MVEVLHAFLSILTPCLRVPMHTHRLWCFYACRIIWFKGIGDKMQAFHISAIILFILVMKRHYYLKAVCQKWIGSLIPGHWTTICITNVLRNQRLEETTEILMDCQVQLSPSQSAMHQKFCPEQPMGYASLHVLHTQSTKHLWNSITEWRFLHKQKPQKVSLGEDVTSLEIANFPSKEITL